MIVKKKVLIKPKKSNFKRKKKLMLRVRDKSVVKKRLINVG